MKTEINIAIGLLMLASPAFAGGSPAKAPLFTVVPLVSNQAGVAKVTDPNLINPWGLAQVSPSSPLWVSDAGTGLSTVYDQGTGQNTGLVVTIPGGSPTGTVYVSGGGFKVTENSKSASAEFLFDSLTGVISGWAPSVDATNAVTAYDGSAQGSSYTGLAIDTSSHLLFAADFANNQVQIFNDQFVVQSSFTDTTLPKGYSPFNVAIIGGQVYVAFAQGGGSDFTKIPKAGAGYVDIFTESGTLVKQLIAKGKLDGPWGMAIAPSTFGSFAGSLLVGNLDNGMINAYDPSAGTYLGTLSTKKGKPIIISELWALDAAPNGDITFSSGPAGYSAGLVGLIEIKAKKN
jgi:uncharacterized protein (TIGR03118 family)